MRKKRNSSYLRYSIWLTACIVIVLIILLAITVYTVHERTIIELFSAQKSTIAHHIASRLEETITAYEKTLTVFASKNSASSVTRQARKDTIKDLSNELGNGMMLLVEIDANDGIVAGYPQGCVSGSQGITIDDLALTHTLKKLHQVYAGEIRFPTECVAFSEHTQEKALGIGVPLLAEDLTYDGAVVAFFSLQKMVEAITRNDRGFPNGIWLVDESGKIVFHPDQNLVGKKLDDLTQTKNTPARIFLYNPRNYSELTLYHENRSETFILAHEPFRIGSAMWWFVLATPYDQILSPIRKASLNIILGAVGLIAVVLITATSIARYDVRRLRLKEEYKRLKEREAWQARLLREKMTIEGIIEGSPVPTFVVDRNHEIILWNHACTELTGYTAEEMIGTHDHYKPFYESKRPLLADLIINRDEQSISAYYRSSKLREFGSIRGAYQAVEHFRNLNGKDRHLHFLAAPILDENGEIVAAIETFLDVSNEIELTRSLQEYAETLQSEVDENIRLREEMKDLLNYLQSIIESLPDKIFDLGRDGIVRYVSRPRVQEYEDHRQKGRHFTELVAPEHREIVLKRWEDAQKGIFTPYELEVITRKGEKRDLLITPAPVKGTDRFLLVQRDVTELKELEKKYYESQKLAAIGQLSAGIAHEVRNPLSSIKMSLQILEKRMSPEGNDLKRFKIAQREVEHLEKLVNDVLIYAKPSDPQREPSDIGLIIEQALALVEKSLGEKTIEARKNYPQDMERISVDPSMLIHALINILQNAIDAMAVQGKLEISVADDAHSMVIDISDNGCGIDERDLPHLFNPFFTKKSYGTGLGLTQVSKIIEQHGGKIVVISSQGVGTRFVITLPRESSTEV